MFNELLMCGKFDKLRTNKSFKFQVSSYTKQVDTGLTTRGGIFWGYIDSSMFFPEIPPIISVEIDGKLYKYDYSHYRDLYDLIQPNSIVEVFYDENQPLNHLYNDLVMKKILKPLPKFTKDCDLFPYYINNIEPEARQAYREFTSIPSNLYQNNLDLTHGISFEHTGVNSLPANLFDGMTNINHPGSFADTYITNIPSGFLSSIHTWTSMAGVFSECSKLTSVNNDYLDAPNLGDISSMFQNTPLTSIRSDFFSRCENIGNATRCFSGVGKMTIPETLFKNLKLRKIYGLFQYSAIESIPSKLFSQNNQHIEDASYAFEHSNITSIPSDLFANTIHLNNFSQIFTDTTKLNTVPENLFETGSYPSLTEINAPFLRSSAVTFNGKVFGSSSNVTKITQFGSEFMVNFDINIFADFYNLTDVKYLQLLWNYSQVPEISIRFKSKKIKFEDNPIEDDKVGVGRGFIDYWNINTDTKLTVNIYVPSGSQTHSEFNRLKAYYEYWNPWHDMFNIIIHPE